MAQSCCLLHHIKQSCLLQTFLKLLILMTLVSLYLFSLLRIVGKKKKIVEKVKTNLDSPKASGPDCIQVVFLKNCQPELSYLLAKVFNMCLKEFCFPDCWKVSSVVPMFKNIGKRSTDKN